MNQQICVFEASKIASDISMETQIPNERITIDWKLRNFYQLCPPGVQTFDHVYSPEFSAGDSVDKPSIWAMSVSGNEGYLTFGLNLVNLGFSGQSESYRPSSSISGSMTLILKNAEGTLLNVTRSPRFDLGTEIGDTTEMRNFTSIASVWAGRTDFEIENALHFEIVLHLHGDPVGETVEHGVDRSASQPLSIEDNRDDILIECEDHSFPVHKSILSERSKRFAAMLSPGTAEIDQDKIHLHDLNADTADTVFHFMYTEEFPQTLSVDEAYDLLEAAKNYEIRDLALKTFSVICEDLDTENYHEILALHKEFGGDSESKEMLEKFFKENRRDLKSCRRKS